MVIGFCALIAAILVVRCSGGHSRPNIVLITLDTTRWGHVSCYGYAKKTIPAISLLSAPDLDKELKARLGAGVCREKAIRGKKYST